MRLTLSVSVLFFSLSAHAVVAQGTLATPSHTDVPVKSVVLFSSGVGYFEHAGLVRGDGSTELRFKTTQINDILKSLVLQDQDGGRVTTITYPSQDPISKTLRSFQVDITGNPAMASLLTQLRGARVTVQTSSEKISGTILGVETRRKPVDKGEPVETSVLNIITGAMIRSIELPSVSALTLDDPQLEEELTKALSALGQARDQDKKPVTINFTGNGERHIRIGYVVETPIWKTSYRLMLEEKSAHLQGWAIVENQTESDWNNISLSLVSGRPISFMMDLYQPLYLQRPTVVPELYRGLSSQVYGPGAAENSRPVALRDLVSNVTVQTNPLVPRDQVTTRAMIGEFSVAGQNAASNTVQSAATVTQLGELFQYNIPNVTLARQKSAMLPIVTDTVSVERVSIYNASVLAHNPLNGVRLKNTTRKHLQQGPVTVLEKNVYAGDARIDDVPPGQERLMSFGIDLDLQVDNTKNTQSNAVVTAKIIKGALLIERKLVGSQDYQIDNKGSRDKVILIEHPIRQGWKLAEGMKPAETTPALYRFQGMATAGKFSILTVREENVRQESITMLPADIGQLLSYSRTGEIPQAVRDAIIKAIQMKQAIVDLDAQVATRTSQLSDITIEQERIRQDMKAVEPKSTYYDRLLGKLNDQESAIERLQKERDDLQGKSDAAQKALSEYLNGLTVG